VSVCGITACIEKNENKVKKKRLTIKLNSDKCKVKFFSLHAMVVIRGEEV
jgi:hypothetical protein